MEDLSRIDSSCCDPPRERDTCWASLMQHRRSQGTHLNISSVKFLCSSVGLKTWVVVPQLANPCPCCTTPGWLALYKDYVYNEIASYFF